MFRKRGDEEVMENDIDKMVVEHWEYVKSVLVTHGVNDSVVNACGHHYRTAFKHGYKHAKEETRERLFTRRGEKEVYEFAEEMIETLNLPKNKIKGPWNKDKNEELFDETKLELAELGAAISGDGNICSEAADVALRAMMIYDNNKER